MQIVIIGHGSSPIGNYLGGCIDCMDIIVRMHDHTWQSSLDYGTRTNFCVVKENRLEECRNIPQPLDGYLVYGSLGPGPSSFNGMIIKNISEEIKYIEEEISSFGRTSKIISHKPASITRGLAGALGIIKIFTPSVLHMVGFDSLKSGFITEYNPGFLIHISSTQGRYPHCGGQEFNERHDYALERNIFYREAASRSVKINWLT